MSCFKFRQTDPHLQEVLNENMVLKQKIQETEEKLNRVVQQQFITEAIEKEVDNGIDKCMLPLRSHENAADPQKSGLGDGDDDKCILAGELNVADERLIDIEAYDNLARKLDWAESEVHILKKQIEEWNLTHSTEISFNQEVTQNNLTSSEMIAIMKKEIERLRLMTTNLLKEKHILHLSNFDLAHELDSMDRNNRKLLFIVSIYQQEWKEGFHNESSEIQASACDGSKKLYEKKPENYTDQSLGQIMELQKFGTESKILHGKINPVNVETGSIDSIKHLEFSPLKCNECSHLNNVVQDLKSRLENMTALCLSSASSLEEATKENNAIKIDFQKLKEVMEASDEKHQKQVHELEQIIENLKFSSVQDDFLKEQLKNRVIYLTEENENLRIRLTTQAEPLGKYEQEVAILRESYKVLQNKFAEQSSCLQSVNYGIEREGKLMEQNIDTLHQRILRLHSHIRVIESKIASDKNIRTGLHKRIDVLLKDVSPKLVEGFRKTQSLGKSIRGSLDGLSGVDVSKWPLDTDELVTYLRYELNESESIQGLESALYAILTHFSQAFHSYVSNLNTFMDDLLRRIMRDAKQPRNVEKNLKSISPTVAPVSFTNFSNETEANENDQSPAEPLPVETTRSKTNVLDIEPHTTNIDIDEHQSALDITPCSFDNDSDYVLSQESEFRAGISTETKSVSDDIDILEWESLKSELVANKVLPMSEDADTPPEVVELPLDLSLANSSPLAEPDSGKLDQLSPYERLRQQLKLLEDEITVLKPIVDAEVKSRLSSVSGSLSSKNRSIRLVPDVVQSQTKTDNSQKVASGTNVANAIYIFEEFPEFQGPASTSFLDTASEETEEYPISAQDYRAK